MLHFICVHILTDSEFRPNLVNVHFRTQDQSFGTLYPWISVLNQTLRVECINLYCVILLGKYSFFFSFFFMNILMTYFLDSRLTY